MYAAMAFLAKIASDYRKPNGQFAITPDLAEASTSGDPKLRRSTYTKGHYD
jgi:nucleotidyltransferase/DNA polymerase involved in DNA repair